MQLREKQKIAPRLRRLERQFRNYFDEAERHPGVTGENLLRPLETAPRQRRVPAGLRVSRAPRRASS